MLTAARALRSDSLLVLSLLSRSSSSFAAEYSGRLLSLSRLQPPWMARAALPASRSEGRLGAIGGRLGLMGSRLC